MAAKEKEADELLVELEKLQQAAEQDMEALKLLHREQQQELQAQIDELNTGMTGQGETVRGQTFVVGFMESSHSSFNKGKMCLEVSSWF